MIKHIWSVLCEESLINQDNNSLTLSKIIEGIEIKLKAVKPEGQKIVLPLNFEIVTMLATTKEEKDKNIEIQVIYSNPSMKEIGKSVSPIVIPAGKTTMRNRLKMSGLPIQGAGQYVFLVSIKEESDKASKKVAELPLLVSINRD